MFCLQSYGTNLTCQDLYTINLSIRIISSGSEEDYYATKIFLGSNLTGCSFFFIQFFYFIFLIFFFFFWGGGGGG